MHSRLIETEIILIKPGEKFGGINGDFFDDSAVPDFTCRYISGISAYGNNESMESYQFSYSSDNDNQNSIETQVYGDQKSVISKKFDVTKDERIYKVTGQIINEKIVAPNSTNIAVVRITGLQFFSTNGLVSPSYNGRLGQSFTEKFDGYTLRYVTGRSTQYIHQLQFFWYRTVNEC
ncbi:unnamed protein product [Rotaria socialis]|uniref:Jacalin-type lectin domain-containing protein n=1 Tax=Rotaria socialis TaxID=392032 RepID=A0A818S3Y5_9BILA|nr:unnamed protein product [Rotaria socialis]CAF3313493.1 unnamed protein product [Rotaria socialis]CAF3341162.1 unnamed protein product [Rotaria socialis]CAF3603133.1 unnamed protein product [Rotaria socialis]CAF3666388.1 unnamed protein product [Rotaria socialis]